jgi:hypothetical protein
MRIHVDPDPQHWFVRTGTFTNLIIYNNGPEEFYTSLNFLASYPCSQKGEVRQQPSRDGQLITQRECGTSRAHTRVVDPDPEDPYVFGPPRFAFGSDSHKYGSGSGSGSFHHQAKIVRKPSFLLFCDCFMTFYQCSGSTTGSGSVPMFLGLPYSHPDPLDTGANPRIRIRTWIRTKMLRIYTS